ncbi:cysteine-rich secretory protein 2 [Eurytemora carolleeae]|uniref:cysteine-rich secretory protein 2 n=1 Tax=Eurytemora carolleeae TaxID=1294199 RepID=UPI000C772EDF|nr:cysteine-rich secretory protein 2 [Eurytemora carolleeae]|eukprot:XP_023344892.1 cysteine-rich secretory protein 2-like [Eurytemora affinis]
MYNLVELCFLLMIVSDVCPRRFSRVPRIGYHKIQQHSQLNPQFNTKLRSLIVKSHNYFRSNVDPPAADMLKMVWDQESAKMSQSWAEKCRKLEHTPSHGRFTKRFGSCGQNILIASHPVPWFFVVESWWLERKQFTFGQRGENDLNQVGHYTQLVWNASHSVGCGFHKCSNSSSGEKYFTYVCNYCPAGNFMNRLDFPYTRGEHCSLCSDHCISSTGKLCTNYCPVADFWTNCQDLMDEMENECGKEVEKCGMCNRRYYQRSCRATCNCRRKLHRHF